MPSKQRLSDYLVKKSALEKLTLSNISDKRKQKISGFLFLLFFYLLFQSRAVAQLTPDTTLGGESSVVSPGVVKGKSAERIDGGALRDSNLFHSFLEFNLDAGERVYFSSPVGVENILTRVTGANPSNILGTLGVDGAANLFLMNPNGFLFGINARLDVKGSFFASTASSLVFADSNQFSASSPQNSSVLTVKVPVGLQFSGTPQPIQVQGASLQLTPGKTVGLVGGEVILQGGTVAAPSGRVELGSVAGNSLVKLSPTTNGWNLDYTGVKNFQNIQLSQGATVDVSGIRGGDIQVQAQSFQLSGGSRLTALTLGTQPGGTVSINASKLVELTGTGTFIEDTLRFATGKIEPANLRNGIYTASFGSGAAGDVVINAPAFKASNGVFIATSTFGSGQGGDLQINAAESVNLSASSLLTGTAKSGNAGSVTINTGRFVAQENATITTASIGTGRAGDLTVNAADSIELIGANPVPLPPRARLITGFFSSAIASGDAGNLRVTTGQLQLRNGAAISANTFTQGEGGDITVTASQSVELIGSSPDGVALSALTNGAEANSTGQGGNLTVTTGTLLLQDGGRLSVRSRGTKNAGDIKVVADSIRLDNQGSIAAASTVAGGGGNIQLQAQSLQLRHNSIISAEAGGSGDGGNITINTDNLVILENSTITGNAFQGTGGNIQIATQGLFFDPSSQVTASSTLGVNGIVEIDTSVSDVQASITPLEGEFISPEQVVANSCLARRNFERGSFTVTGTSGLPASPDSAFMERYAATEVQPFSRGTEGQTSLIQNPKTSQAGQNWQLGGPIQEAQGMRITADGRVIAGTSPQLRAFAKAEQLVCRS